MDLETLYPKTIEKLFEKADFILRNEENVDTIAKINKWIEWFKRQAYTLNYKCKKNEYLRYYYDGEKMALQVWCHGKIVDSSVFNLLTNFYSEYDSDDTIVNIEDENFL